ncbi:putative Major facilitator superfamily (MFS) profile domain-containing protein [Seiridium cardinale]|uniref:Major facilitator superfamily (MFS) profile domain-containing protein n=1 Tax=Seiridium cardinale TaxID=138064 RepID=A0ABR2Y189_9PEZI
MAAQAASQDAERLPDVERHAPTPRTNSSSSVTVASDNGNGSQSNGAPQGAVTSNPPEGTSAEPKVEDDVPEASRTKLQTCLIMFALCSGLFLAALDMTIVATAVPTIVSEFNSSSGYTWISAAYTLANAATVPSWGKISDIWGRKPILMCAVAVFWIGSLICALSINMGMLIAARAIQGAGSGGIVVLVNIAISDLFSMRSRGVYYGILGMVWALSSAIGPVVGGAFTQNVTWRWCFWVNLPISACGFAILFFVLKLHNPKTSIRQGLAAIDWLGSLLIIGGTLMVLFGLELGGVAYPWNSATPICLIVFGVVTIGLFVVVEQRYARYPVIPLRLFRKRSSVLSFGVCFCHAFVFISGSYYLPLYFQGVLGASPLLSGVYLLPYALSLSFMSAGVGIITKKTGKYLPQIIFGMFVMTLGFGLFIDLEPRANWPKVILFQIVAGIGVGPNFQSPLISLQSSVEKRDIAAATSTFGFIRQLSTSISVVVGGVIFQNEMEKQYPTLLQSLGPELANQLSGSSAGGSVTVVGALQGEQGTIARSAYWSSLQTMFILYTAVSGLGLLISPFVGQRTLTKEHKDTKTGLHTLRVQAEQDHAPSEKKEESPA